MRVKVRFRALVIALVVLLVIEVVLRLPFVVLPIPEGYRIPSRTVLGYNELIQSMSRQPGVRVAVVGDSIVWGGFSLPEESLSAYLQKALDAKGLPNRSYNLGFVGAHANDLMPIVADIAQDKAADVIVLNFDYRFYNRRSSVDFRYPEVYDKVDWSGLPVPEELTRPKRSKETTPTTQTRVDKAIAPWWRLFGIRDYLTTALFGDTPGDAIQTAFSRYRARLGGRPLWSKRPTERLPLDKLKDMFALGPLTEDDPYMRYLGAALDAAKAEGVPVVVFAGPVDTKLLDGENLWDRAEYDRNLEFVRRFVEARGGTFYDYTDGVPGEYLFDSHHPMAAGYERLAELIAADIAPLVRSAEESRSAGVGASQGGDRP